MKGPLLQDVNRMFVSLRICLLLLIINDAKVMLCDPFNFKKYAETKHLIQRYLCILLFWFIFHIPHLLSITIFTIHIFWRKNKNFIFHLTASEAAMILAKLSLRAVFTISLVIWGSIQCFEMAKSLKEMDQNEFAKNKHCDSLYKMCLAFLVLIATSIPVEVGYEVFLFMQPRINIELYVKMTKALHDTMFSILVMIIFVLSFPRMRPRLKERNQNG